MKLLWSLLVLMLLALQYRLWIGEGSFSHASQLQAKVSAQSAYNQALQERNARLDAEVLDLKSGYAAIEERARADLGMIAKNETFFMVVSDTH